MIKSTLVFATFLLFSGCASKTVTQRADEYYKPTTSVVNKPITAQEANAKIQQDAPKPLDEDAQNPNHPENTLGEEYNPEQEPMEIEVSPALEYPDTKSYVTTFKTKQFSFADTGFMREENGVIDLQILALGKPLLTLKIADDICVDHFCRTKEEFNANYLSRYYPEDLINQVLMAQPIMEKKGYRETSNGFLQRIKAPHYDIKYKITPGSIYFKDLKNGIIIKLRELQ